MAAYWDQVVSMNDFQKSRFVNRMLEAMFNTVSGKQIAILGYAFKKDTNDSRESPAIDICRHLLEEKACLRIYDPKVPASEIYETLGLSQSDADTSSSSDAVVTCCSSAEEACEGAHALAILTEWDAFRDLDYAAIYDSMVKPAFVFRRSQPAGLGSFGGNRFSSIRNWKGLGPKSYLASASLSRLALSSSPPGRARSSQVSR